MKSILVIEDDDQVRLPLVDLLEANGYAVDSAAGGKEGIQLAKDSPPDLIISDIMMPEIDGYAVFEAMQNDPKTAIIPFVFLTAKTDPDDIREGLGLGADDYLTKPFQSKTLLEESLTKDAAGRRLDEDVHAVVDVRSGPEATRSRVALVHPRGVVVVLHLL